VSDVPLFRATREGDQVSIALHYSIGEIEAALSAPPLSVLAELLDLTVPPQD
jgi:hypothetical protein